MVTLVKHAESGTIFQRRAVEETVRKVSKDGAFDGGTTDCSLSGLKDAPIVK